MNFENPEYMIMVLDIHALLSSKIKGVAHHMNILQNYEVIYLEQPTSPL